MKQTKTVAGWRLSTLILELEMTNCEIRTMTRGDTNGTWVIEYETTGGVLTAQTQTENESDKNSKDALAPGKRLTYRQVT